jgi:2-polyprenyl-3-methyl-5-hydroxy-6-metoxy-1,4-benzoquinol methylase
MKTAFSCVVDANPKFEWQALLWAHSLLRNSGCNSKDLKIHCLPGVTSRFRETMAALGVVMVDTRPFDGNHRYCNKIQQCFSEAFREYDRVVLTDTDLFFLAVPRFAKEITTGGMVVRVPNPPLKALKMIYDEAGVGYGEEVPVSCALNSEELTFCNNLNGGFYVFDSGLLKEIGEAWRNYALWLIDRIGSLGGYKAHVDQVAMALALDRLNIKAFLLDSRCNFSVNVGAGRLSAIIASERLKKIDVLHYHASVLPSGEIKPSGVPLVDEAILRANREISAIIRDQYDNLLYWNNRYAAFPELGSGIGSRGKTLKYKQALLKDPVAPFIEDTVLEVGCGDLETSKDFKFKNYIGYDLSEAALQMARQKCPDWEFVQGSLYPHNENRKADLVICLDVLIHQKKREDYHGLLSALVWAAKKRLIVSGYEQVPQLVSNITAFHEPLGKTLRSFGVFNEIIEIGRYNDVSLFVADVEKTGPALHRNDLPLEIFNTLAPLIERRDILKSIMDRSRETLGFFTQTSSRMIEYPWVMERLLSLTPDSNILDIGSGVSPVPILLSERGLFISCVDAHPKVRKLDQRKNWNEWGFLDYSIFSPRIESFHTDIQTFEPREKFDAVYSISVLEHMPRQVWRRTLERLSEWLKPGGWLFLTLDLIPGTYALWNKSEGRVVDCSEDHGLLKDVTDSLKTLGFAFEELFVRQNIPYSQTDVAFLKCWLKSPAQLQEGLSVPGPPLITQEQHPNTIHQRKSAPTMAASERKQLFLHIGSPKTGTSYLQSFMFENYENLKSKNVLYPKSLIGSAADPKHQPLFASLFTDNEKRFYDLLRRMAHETNGSTEALILSSEGFYHHINEFTESSWRLLKSLGDLFEIKIVVYLRPQSEYVESMYRQYMKNPRGVNAEFGSSLSIYEMMERPKLRQNLDYYDSLMKWAAVVGEENILVRRYAKNVVEDFMTLLKLEIKNPKKANRTNPSITREMAELLRQLNDSVDEKRRGLLIRRMEDYLGDHPEVSDQPILSPEESAALMARFREGNTLLAQKWFKEDELFPDRRIVADSPWSPVTARQDVLINLLQQLSG